MAFIIAVSCACTPATEADGDWGIRLEPSARWEEDRLMVDTALEVLFSPAAIEALEHGVAITLVVTTRTSRRMGPLAREQERRDYPMEIRYLPLSRHWQLTDARSGTVRSFARRWMLEQALAGETRRFETGLTQADLEHGRWQVQVRAALDRNALPPPMHLPALLSSEWRLSTRWHTWHPADA